MLRLEEEGPGELASDAPEFSLETGVLSMPGDGGPSAITVRVIQANKLREEIRVVSSRRKQQRQIKKRAWTPGEVFG